MPDESDGLTPGQGRYSPVKGYVYRPVSQLYNTAGDFLGLK